MDISTMDSNLISMSTKLCDLADILCYEKLFDTDNEIGRLGDTMIFKNSLSTLISYLISHIAYHILTAQNHNLIQC